jgi:sugar (pentulose or hexulose) kinase
MDHILSLDLGTTAIKVAVVDGEGQMLAVSTQEYALLTPDALSVELDVETYWAAFKRGIAEVLEKSRIMPSSIRALGISAQGETLVPVDREGAPLRRAIVWMDNRAQAEAEEMNKLFGPEKIYSITGQVSMVPTWPAAKLRWLRLHESATFEKAAKFLLIEDYFIFRLTGRYVAEGSLLCSTAYWDIRTKTWWGDMLSYLGVSADRLPEIKESGEEVGHLLDAVAKELGLSAETRVCTGALDQAAGAIGVGNIAPGIFSENTGAALAICATLKKPFMDPARAMPCHYHALPDTYMAHTFTTGGMVLRWFRDSFCSDEMSAAALSGIDAYDLLSREAATVAPGCEGLVMLPHLQGAMAPEANPRAKGVFYGITMVHRKPHFVRAIMEGVGFIVRRNVDALEGMGISVGEIRCLGGGSRSAVWNQIKADVTGRRVVTTGSHEAACLGAAIVAGVGVGMFGSLEEACTRMVVLKASYDPDPKVCATYDDLYEKYKGLYEALVPMFAR